MRDFLVETESTARPASCFAVAWRPAAAHVAGFRALLALEPGAAPGPALLAGLADPALEALADLMPLLLCGEESAALAFDGLRHAAQARRCRRVWAAIAGEERLHEYMLGHLVGALDADALPGAARTRRRARLFFMRLRSDDALTHFARIAALDCLVTRVLAAMLGRASLLHGPAPAARLLARIRADEARHVAATRGFVLASDGCHDRLRAERDGVAGAFRAFLAPAGDAFERLGVDPRVLEKCLH